MSLPPLAKGSLRRPRKLDKIEVHQTGMPAEGDADLGPTDPNERADMLTKMARASLRKAAVAGKTGAGSYSS